MKKSSIRTISVICLVCILMLAMLSACNDNSINKPFYKATSFDDNNVPDGITMNPNTLETIGAFEQFEKFCNDVNMQINDESGLDYDCEVYKKLRSYDEVFFKNKLLIIVLIGKPYPRYLEFANLKIDGDTLIINILNEDNPYITKDKEDAYDEHLFLIEIKKDAIKDVKKVITREYYQLNIGD